MKKLTLTLVAIIISCITFAQVEIKGAILQINKGQLLDSGGYKINKTTYPMAMRMRLNDNKLTIISDHNLYFPLTDKMVDSSDNQLVHYLSNAYKKTWIVAARECEGFLHVAILPMDGRTKFTEYVIKYKTK